MSSITDDRCLVLAAANGLCSKGRENTAKKLVEQLDGRVKMKEVSRLLREEGIEAKLFKEQDPEKTLEKVLAKQSPWI